MALTLGTNIGFVSSAPTTQPGGSGININPEVNAQRHTSPTGSYKVTEIGFWCIQDPISDGAFEVGIYADDAVNNRPGALVGKATGNNSGTIGSKWLKYTGLSIALTSNTVYWIAVGVSDVTTARAISYATEAGVRCVAGGPAQGNLPDPSWGTTASLDGYKLTIYALYAAAASGPSIPIVMHHYKMLRG